MTERERALKLANIVLEQHSRDPDDDMSVLARHLVRQTERADALHLELCIQKKNCQCCRDALGEALHLIKKTSDRNSRGPR